MNPLHLSFISGLVVLGIQISPVRSQGDPLVQPTVIDSSSGVLDTTLTLEYADITGPHYKLTNARLFNGIFPGPTLRLSAGDTLKILFENKLELQENAVQEGDNIYHKPDHSNLHFHGGHVSGELPSDDVRYSVAPQDSYQYETDFPSNHMPGTHWMHPHLHGSTSLQVGSGASLAMIVKDPDGYLPSQVEDADEVLLFVQTINSNAMNGVVDDIMDGKLSIEINQGADGNFRTVNGQYQPVLSMMPGEWQRWRIVYAGYLVDPLNFKFEPLDQCEMKLLAKDGIYINDYPRDVSSLPIPAGGRADVMVRCASAGEYSVVDYEDEVILTVSVSGTPVSSTDLEAWTAFSHPDYLQDLVQTEASTGCACSTEIAGCGPGGRFCLNGNPFDVTKYIHTVAFNSVVQRDLVGFRRHPYHQHVYPFQLVDGVNTLRDAHEQAYFQTGDWHDVFQADTPNVQVRYRAHVHTGVIMLHCHILTHEDKGAMSQELVIDGGDCACDALATKAPTAVPSPGPSDLSAKPSISNTPSINPSTSPSLKPSTSPSINPSTSPSINPSTSPSINPSTSPSINPTAKKSDETSGSPSTSPSINPTAKKSDELSGSPSTSHSSNPTTELSNAPSGGPPTASSSNPTTEPTESDGTTPAPVATTTAPTPLCRDTKLLTKMIQNILP